MTKQKLQEELIAAVKSGDEIKKSTLRMLISAIGYYQTQRGGAGYQATEDDVLSVLQSEVKKHRDSIEQYEKAGRNDLADKEKAELAILQGFMPEQMTKEEISTLVDQVILQTNASTQEEMGKVMSALIPLTKGKADQSLVSRIVKEKLSS